MQFLHYLFSTVSFPFHSVMCVPLAASPPALLSYHIAHSMGSRSGVCGKNWGLVRASPQKPNPVEKSIRPSPDTY